MLKGAIFDVDGVIMDTMPMLDGCSEDYLRHIGIAPKGGLNARVRPMSFMDACALMKAEYALPGSPADIMKAIGEYIFDAYMQLPPKDGIAEALEFFRSRGVRMAIATANDSGIVRRRFREIGIADYFCGIFTATELGVDKNVPDIFRAALAATGASKEEAIVFEDSLHAIRTAAADGFTVCGVYDTTEDWASVQKHADICLTSWRDVPALFAESF